jgi:transposase
MPASIAQVKKARIKTKIELGLPPQVIFQKEHVSLRTIQRFTTNIKRHGSIQAPKALQQGRPRSITPEMEQVSHSIALQTRSNISDNY